MGHWDARVGRRRDPRRYPRHHLEADAGGGERLRLLAAAAEHERVAALQAHDPVPGSSELDELRVDLLLRGSRCPRLLAHVAELGVGARALECTGRDQAVVEDHLRRGDQLQSTPSHQPGIARASADQIHDAARHARKR
jgi:hypothetical protein